MAKKRHGGLGRGLDALIPMAGINRSSRENNKKNDDNNNDNKENADVEMNKSSGENLSAGSSEMIVSQSPDPASDRKDESGQVFLSGRPEQTKNTYGYNENSYTGQPDTEVSPGSSDRNLSPGQPDKREEPVPGAGASPDTANAGVQILRLSQVDPNRSQPRRIFEEDALEELADSIRQFGVLQPILVQKKDGRYEIIAGERRWRACRKAGLKEIPAIIREYSDQETLELSLIENIQREDLNPIEEAKAFKSLIDEFGLRQEDLAVRVSKSRTAITNSVRLLKLDERVQDMIIQKEISMGHARALIPLEIPEEQFLIARQIADRHLSVRDVEKLIKKRKAAGASSKKKNPGTESDPALELSYREIEERMKQSLGTKVSIRYGRDGKGKMEIDFYSHEDLERIVDLMG